MQQVNITELRNRPEWMSMAISQNEISEQARVLSYNAVSMAA